jgi:excisionase family DNA binding protein
MPPPSPVVKFPREHRAFFRLPEAAALLGVSIGTVRRWTIEGTLPSVRTIGNHRRIPRAAVEALADLRTDAKK